MFIILEAQTNLDGTVGNILTGYENRDEAESKYHSVLSAAAISDLPLHSAFMLTNDAHVIKSECYRHEQPEQTPEPEEPVEEEQNA